MEHFAWMAWTWPTAGFFVALFLILGLMTVLAARRPEGERVGILGIGTTRGDRLFITLLGSAFIHLAWIGLIGPNLWWASVPSLLYAWGVFRWV